MPSDVIVTDRNSLAQNFSENSKQVLCSAAFGAGAYAIGGSLLGFPPLTPAGALVTGGALITALALCPSNASQEAIFGSPPTFSGGQCSAVYDVVVRLFAPNGSSQDTEGRIQGPVRGLRFLDPPSVNLSGLYIVGSGGGGPDGESYAIVSSGSPAQIPSSNIVSVRRVDGQPDNCGNAPNTGGQIISNVTNGDTIDNSKVVNNSDFSTVIPVEFNLGGISNTLNLQFGPIEIESLLPVSFNINIGGSNFRFKERPDGTLEPEPTNPDKSKPNDKLEKTLKEVKDCVCTPVVDLDMLLLPVVLDDGGCKIVTETFLVPKGSVSDSQFQRFVDSANLAREGCLSAIVSQLPQTLIFSASTTDDGREIFTGKIAPDVVSLVLKITDIRESGPPKINLYAASNQRKFGSVSFVMDGVRGGGDYLYVFDEETYIPLSKRGKEGRLRILMKKGLSFEVYDSGERV